MTKRKKKSSKIQAKKSSKLLHYFVWGLAVIALALSALIAGYYYGYEQAQKEIVSDIKAEKEKRLQALKKLEELSAKEEKKETELLRLQKLLKKESAAYTGASHEYDDKDIDVAPPKRFERKFTKVSEKPKLAIIIDDVSVRSHIKAIKSLGIPLTMSFLPPSAQRPNSAKLAANEKFYMVHLPMEAQSFSAEEPNTLRVEDSQAKISKRIENLKKLFPRVTYINNHTGSKFTADERAMNHLIYALNKNNIYFIDSRTTAQTKAPKVLKNYGLRYLSRDVFLDHKMEKSYVKKQIKKAIEVAKAHGSAIAIGHPHANTILALHESKKLLEEVELVYVNKL